MAEIFLIIGPEPLQFYEQVQSFSSQAKEKYGEFAFYSISYKENSLSEILQEIVSPAFFGGKKIVKIEHFPPSPEKYSSKKNEEEESNEKKKFNKDKKKTEEEFVKSLEQAPEDTVVIFTSLNPDKRTFLYKAIAKLAKKTYEFPLANEKNQNEITFWIQKRAEKYGISLPIQIAEYLGIFVGNSFFALDQELKKLFLYCGTKNISKQDIDTLCFKTTELPSFALSNVALSGNPVRILETLRNLLESDENITVLYRDILPLFRNLIHLSFSLQERKTASEIGMHPFVFQNTKKILQYTSQKKLLISYSKIQKIDALSRIGYFPLTGNSKVFALEMEKILLSTFSSHKNASLI
jgi:DNA polymerase III delta subunit